MSKLKTIKLEPIEEMLLETMNRANHPISREIFKVDQEIEQLEQKRHQLQEFVDRERVKAFKIISDMRGEPVPVNAVASPREGDEPPTLSWPAPEEPEKVSKKTRKKTKAG